MRTEQVEAVLAIAATSSFRGAAARLGVSQSALSATVRKLEAEVGVPLLIRSHEGTRLSPAGSAAFDAMRTLAAAADDLRTVLAAQTSAGPEVIRVATVSAAVNTVLPQALRGIADDPGAEARVQVGGSGDVLDQVVAGDADLGLIVCEPDDQRTAPGIRAERLLTAPIGVVVPLGHRLAAQPTLVAADLDGERTISFREGYLMHRLAGGLLGAIATRVVSEVTSTPEAVRLVAAGVGICVVPQFSVTGTDAVSWRPLADREQHIALVLIAPRTPRSPRVGQLLLDLRERGRTHRFAHRPASASTIVRETV
ncbi:MAG: LysR family transcriptional regulator [Gordonia sp. (in: high G+C Gram-positive bacteria)]